MKQSVKHITKTIFAVIIIVAMIAVMGGCGGSYGKGDVEAEPREGAVGYKDEFYQKTRFIMTEEEIEIYKHLPDRKAREEFVEEFWKKRDPNPETEENENREEYRERIEYANKWFKEASAGRGWDTERGRILLQLGFPNNRAFGESENIPGEPRTATSRRVPMEVWTYYNYQLELVFVDTNDSGRLRLIRIPPNMGYALERAKFSLDLRDFDRPRHAFAFDAEFSGNRLLITVPVKKISFQKDKDDMIVDFDVTVYVYLDSEKIDQVRHREPFRMESEKVLAMKAIQFSIPYPTRQNGKYYFDVIIEEKSSGARFRDFARHKE